MFFYTLSVEHPVLYAAEASCDIHSRLLRVDRHPFFRGRVALANALDSHSIVTRYALDSIPLLMLVSQCAKLPVTQVTTKNNEYFQL